MDKQQKLKKLINSKDEKELYQELLELTNNEQYCEEFLKALLKERIEEGARHDD